MKRVRRFGAVAACCSAFAAVSVLPAFSDTQDISVYTQVDPDGVPLSLSQPGVMTPALAAAEQRAQTAAGTPSKDSDWLVRGYEEQLRSHAAPGSTDANLYLELSSNKELAAIAGVSPIDAQNQTSNPSLAPGRSSTANLGGMSMSNPANSAGGMFQWRPLITPIGSSSLLSTQNSLAGSTPLFAAQLGQGQRSAPIKTTAPDVDASMLETPGMVAAAKDPTFDDTTPDLSLDLLPGESPSEAMQRQGQARLSAPTTADELHQQEASQLNPPKAQAVANNNTKTDDKKKTDTKPAPMPDENAPTPVSQVQPVSPVRSPIANPYSILNH